MQGMTIKVNKEDETDLFRNIVEKWIIHLSQVTSSLSLQFYGFLQGRNTTDCPRERHCFIGLDKYWSWQILDIVFYGRGFEESNRLHLNNQLN